MLRPLFALVACAGLLVLASGCAHYQLGAGAKPTFTTLYVEPVTTKILLPQSQATLETQISAAFVRDGRVTLVNSPEAAEATLKLHLIDYRREVATQRRDDTGLARKFTLTLSAACTLTDRRTGRPFLTNVSSRPAATPTPIVKKTCPPAPSLAANFKRNIKPCHCSPKRSPPKSPTPSSTCGEAS